VDGAGDAYVTGATLSDDFPIAGMAYQSRKIGYPSDAFISKLNPTATALLYSSYLGGTAGDGGQGIAIDDAGNAYVTGFTGSSDDFHLTTDATQPQYGGSSDDAFVAKLPTVSGQPFVTYLGGGGDDQGRGIAFMGGSAYATGTTWSSNFPTTPGVVQPSFGGNTDGFVTRCTF
jgi:hypothetical protein